MVKNPQLMQEMQETQVRFLGQEDPLEEEMATHFSILPWKIPWIEEPGKLQSKGCKKWDTTEHTLIHSIVIIVVWKSSMIK